MHIAYASITIGLLAVGLTGRAPAAAPERGYYDAARLQVMTDNLAKHDWARIQRDQIVQRADAWLKYPDERLRTLVPPPEVPRAHVAHVAGAPVKGEELNKVGAYSWIISFDRPWTVTSPVDGAVYPSNDFAAFMKSGYQDRSLLTGPYPDDGWGCKVEGFDKPFWFVAVYAQWSVSRLLLPALDDLSRAYLLTNDARYAHACALLLWQLAEYYPRYLFENQSRYAKEVQPGYNGRLLYHTWECYTVQSAAPAYDAIRPAIDADAPLQKLTGQTAAQIRERIETRLLRTMATDIMVSPARIAGNYGMHQSGLLRVAAALRHTPGKPASQDMIDWVLANPDPATYAELGLEDALNNLVHRDGFPLESPSYNYHWVTEINDVVENLGPAADRIVAIARFRCLFTWPLRMTCAGQFVPSYGDSNHMFHGPIGWTADLLEPMFRYSHDPRAAQAMAQIAAAPKQDLFHEPLAETMAAATRPAATTPAVTPLGTSSELLPGVGFASLQTGSDANRTALAVFYGYYQGHAHFDRLQLDIYSWRSALLPDFGYPETADSYDPRRFGFLSHTVAHNTVLVDARRQSDRRGRLHLFDAGQFAQTVEVSSEDSYPDRARLYRRTLMLVEVAPDKAYIVDVFRVRGGRQHDWIVHGTQAEFRCDLPLGLSRRQGTLAGEDVPYGHFYDDNRFDNGNKAHVPYYLYEGSGFQWLTNVRQGSLDGVGTVAWHATRPENASPPGPPNGVVLRAHLVGQGETVFACDGVPQRRSDHPATVTFLVRRRSGQDLQSTFVTVFEPFKDTAFIDAVKVLPVQAAGAQGGAGQAGPAHVESAHSSDDMPVALEIVCGDARHLIFSRLDGGPGPSTVLKLAGGATIDARAAVIEQTREAGTGRMYVLDDGGATNVAGFDGKPRAVQCKVEAIDYASRHVTLSEEALETGAPAGTTAIVTSRDHAHAIRVAQVLDRRTFVVEDEDLSAATLYAQTVAGREIRFAPKFSYFMEPGMTVIDESGQAVGRVRALASGTITLEKPLAGLDAFPDKNGDGRRQFRVMVVGPGDTLTFHGSMRRR